MDFATALRYSARQSKRLCSASSAFVASYLSDAVGRLVSLGGDHRAALLLSTFGRLQFASSVESRPSPVDTEFLDVETSAEVKAEAAEGDIASAAAIAAPDHIVAETSH